MLKQISRVFKLVPQVSGKTFGGFVEATAQKNLCSI